MICGIGHILSAGLILSYYLSANLRGQPLSGKACDKIKKQITMGKNQF